MEALRKNSTEKRQICCMLLGVCVFTSVVYLLSVNKTKSNFYEREIFKNKARRPNFIFILTDDQDVVLGSATQMPNVKKYIIDHGVNFNNSFVASPLCCPSRSSILSGQYVHNHKTYNNSINGGCSNKRWQKGPEQKTFVKALHNNGYQTFFAGKYLNQYGFKETGGLAHVPPGWDWWIGLEGNSRYYNYTLSVNGTPEYHGDDPSSDYLTNVIRRQAISFIDQIPSYPVNNPFFMMLSTPACHAPFDAEPKYSDNFTSFKAPRTENFNIINDKTKHWLLRQGEQPLRQGIIDDLDEIYRKRLRTLLTVDEMLGEVIANLEKKNLLNSTYIIFTSDNGYHLGQFSLPLDKREPYEFDIRVPFYIRGPALRKDIVNYPITNIDIGPTVLDLAGLSIPRYFDGESMKPILEETLISDIEMRNQHSSILDYYSANYFNMRKTLLVEHSGEGHDVNYGCEHLGPDLYGCNPEYDCKCSDSKNNTYSCLRHLSPQENFLFCTWEDKQKFEEMYNVGSDPFQLNNTVKYLSPEVHKKLLSTLRNLKKCRGAHCLKVSKFVF